MRSGIISGLIWLGCGHLWGGDFSVSLFYTQTAYNSAAPSVGTVNLQYTLASNTANLSGYATLFSSATDATFGGADGIIVDPINGNLLIAEGGTSSAAGVVFQITQFGAHASPYTVTPDATPNPASTPRVYFLAIAPSNASKSGFPAGYLIGTEKDFGYGHISLMPLAPTLANGIAYPVTGDDIYVTSIAFGSDGTAYYGSGSEDSNAGNFGTIIFNGTQFTTHRLFGQPVGNDPRGGIIYTGTHGLIFDPFTNDIFTTGGNTIGQYDPIANVFHLMPLYGVASNFSFSGVSADGQGHLVVTACCGMAGEAYNGAGDIVIVDYSTAPGQVIDASSGVRYTHLFLASNLGAAIVAASVPSPPSPPVITMPPQNTTALVGQTATFTVAAIGGSSYQWQSKRLGASGFTSIAGATSSSYTTPAAASSDNNTQFVCIVTNNQGSVTSGAATLTVLAGSASYLVFPPDLGSLRNNYTGWVGMSVSIGGSPLTITSLGRMAAPQNSGSHTLKIVDASSSVDVPGATVTVSMQGAAPGSFVYANLSAGVTLKADASYYFLTQEAAGGDQWYDWNTTAQTTLVATIAAAAYGPPYTTASTSAGHLYGPVDFKYAVAVAVTVSPSNAKLTSGGTQQFAATVSGANGSVTWALNPTIGSVSSSGLYSAPATVSSPQTVTVSATSLADPTVFGTASVNLVPPSPPVISQDPQSVTVGVGQTATFGVTASGGSLTYQWQSKISGASAFTPISGATLPSYTTPVVSAADNGTQFQCVVTNPQGATTSGAALLTVTSGTSFVTSSALGTLRNNFTGWVGMAITVGPVPLTVTSLGRIVAAGNSGAHAIKIAAAASGADVPGTLVTLAANGALAGFLYGALAAPVVLSPNTTYYVLSQETAGGDTWYDLNTTLQYNPVASISGAVYSNSSGFIQVPNTTGHGYVPVDFRYIPSQSTVPFALSVTAGTPRNNYSGWVGASITTRGSPVRVTHLGHLWQPGDVGSHSVKLVAASTGMDIPGATVSVNLSSGVSGAFVYAPLPAAVILSPNSTYYLVSQETAGGDPWYDWNTSEMTSSVAFVNGGVYSSDGMIYFVSPSPNRMYVPLDFRYALQ